VNTQYPTNTTTAPATAIVTGGASGLGAATVRRLVDTGHHVVALDLESSIDRARAEGTALEPVTYLAADVTDPAQVRAGVEAASAIAPLRVVVACAGILYSERILHRGGHHDLEGFARAISVNLNGTFNILTLAAEAMAAQEPVTEDGERGVIVLTSSVAAFEGQIGQAAYAASKGGVNALTLTAARDLARSGIRVNAIAPGVVETPMMAQITPEFRQELEARVPFPARLARPGEFAALVGTFLDNHYLNGEVVRLDGALRMPPR